MKAAQKVTEPQTRSKPSLAVDNDPMVGGLTVCERKIRDTASYVEKRITNLNAGAAWVDIGRALAELKDFVKKNSKSDESKDGWYAAFQGGRYSIPFSRRRADQLIAVHKRIAGTVVPTKLLPASARALIRLAELPDSHREKALKLCSPSTTEAEVRRIAKDIGVPTKKKSPPKRATADRFSVAYEAFKDACVTLPKDSQVQEFRNLAFDLGLGALLKEDLQ